MGAEYWAGRKVLVTGAGGFVGSWLTRALVDAGAEVVVLLRDRQAPGGLELVGVQDRVSAVFGSVTDSDVVERSLTEYQVDVCFHLAAQAVVGVANDNPVFTFESNIRGTWTVLEGCRRSPSVRSVVVASSDKAYGSQELLPYSESGSLQPSNPYDVSKAAADMLARSYHHTFGLAVAVSRCANIYGGGDLNFSRLVPGTIRAALIGERPVIRSDGTPLRDYIHVDDAVGGYLALGEHARRADVVGKAFNFGANQPISVIDLTHLILDAADRPDLEADILGTGDLTGEISRQYLDSSLAREVLDWAPTIAINDGLASTVSWYRDHLHQIGALQ